MVRRSLGGGPRSGCPTHPPAAGRPPGPVQRRAWRCVLLKLPTAASRPCCSSQRSSSREGWTGGRQPNRSAAMGRLPPPRQRAAWPERGGRVQLRSSALGARLACLGAPGEYQAACAHGEAHACCRTGPCTSTAAPPQPPPARNDRWRRACKPAPRTLTLVLSRGAGPCLGRTSSRRVPQPSLPPHALHPLQGHRPRPPLLPTAAGLCSAPQPQPAQQHCTCGMHLTQPAGPCLAWVCAAAGCAHRRPAGGRASPISCGGAAPGALHALYLHGRTRPLLQSPSQHASSPAEPGGGGAPQHRPPQPARAPGGVPGGPPGEGEEGPAGPGRRAG